MQELIKKSNDPMEIQYDESNSSLDIMNHYHNVDEIVFVTEGKVEFIINNKKYTACKGDILFISSLERHEIKILEYPYKRFFIFIKLGFIKTFANEPILASIFKQRPENFNHLIRLNSGNYLLVLDIFNKIYSEYFNRKDFWESLLGAYVNYLFIFLYRQYKDCFPLSVLNRSTQMILDIQRYIDQHFLESLSLDDVAKLFYSDRFYISHLYKKITGFTFKDYIIRLRIARAKELLHNTDDDITTVCLNSGFNNVNHFIRIFKKFEDITPYQFRKARVK